MKKYSIWKAVFLSFFSADLYRDVHSNWKGYALPYILLVSFIICAMMIGNWLYVASAVDIEKYSAHLVEETLEDTGADFEQNLNRILEIASNIPAAEVVNGHLNLKNEQSPYFIKDPLNGDDIAIFDTSGKYESLKDTTALILFTKTRIIVRDDSKEVIMNIGDIEKQSTAGEDDINFTFKALSEIPLIKINNGIASIDAEQPHIIYGTDNYKLAVFDTSGEYESIKENDKIYLLLTEKSLFLNNPVDKKITEVKLTDITPELVEEGVLNMLTGVRTMLYWFVPLIVLPALTAATFLFSLLIVGLYSICSIAIARLFKFGEFSYEQLFRIAAVATTPVAVINILLPDIFTHKGIIYFLISTAYIYYALSSVAEHNKTAKKE